MSRSLLGIAALVALAHSLFAQPCQAPSEMRPAVQNLSFSDSPPDTPTAGWHLGPEWFMSPHEPVYEALTASGASCNGNGQCATVHSLRDSPAIPQSFLYQIVDATRYRGQRIAFGAFVRVDPAVGSVARLLVRIHRNDCSTSFRDDMGNHPITSGTWSPYQIEAPIPMDARDIEFGMQLIGRGAAWIDNITLATPLETNDLQIRALVRSFAVARNAHDGQTIAAIYSEDGEWISQKGMTSISGRPALARLWSALNGQAQRTVESVDFVGDNIAVVRVATQFEESNHHESFVFVKDNGQWTIRVHQSLE